LDKASSDQLHLGSVIESDTLTDNDWPDTFRKNWRDVNYDPGSPVGWIPSLGPVRIGAPVDASIIAMLELLAFLEFSDSYCGGVLNHAYSIRTCVGQDNALIIMRALCGTLPSDFHILFALIVAVEALCCLIVPTV